MKRVAIIGAGNVGATAAMEIAKKEIADVQLVDVAEGIPQGKSLDLMESGPLQQHDCRICGSNSCADIADSDVVVITAGLARKPGMSRDDLLMKNSEIVKGICSEIKRCAPDSVVIMVTNPLDTMSYLALKTTGFKPERIIGMAGVLDSARFKSFIADEIKVSRKDIHAMVLGSHGDSMVPLPQYTTVSGIPITQLMPKQDIDKIIERTRKAGAEIVSHLKTGSAYYAPGFSAAEMVEAVIKDSKRIMPASAYLQGQYGFRDIFLGVPIKLGKDGVEQIIEIELNDEDKNALQKSAEAAKKNIKKVKI